MRAKALYKDRYPGLLPFDKGQSTIFFGREQETKELYYQVCLEKMVVLFGKSGLGKSSLLNAGVSPLLERNGYLPIRVRFSSGLQASTDTDSENLLLRDFILAFKGFNYKRRILYNREDPKLWEFIKAVNFSDLVEKDNNHELSSWVNMRSSVDEESAGKSEAVPVVPVFIFDQFEEFFHHPVPHQQEFLSQLAEVLHDETPYRILDWITTKDPEERTMEEINWHQQPVVKMVFALRSDKLANMQSMVPYISTVLRNRYELKPLTPLQAEEAIKGPAAKPDLGPEYVRPFSFEENTLREIVKRLSGESQEIESSQLQIVCNFIEQRVRMEENATPNTPGIEVNAAIINPAIDFPKILDNFYDTQLRKIEDTVNRDLARKLIEDTLVIDGQRDSISKRKLNNAFNIGDTLIEEILNTRLVREENTSRGSFYELSHDTLIAPVEKSKRKREEEEDRKKEKIRAEEERKKAEEEKLLLAQEAKKKDEELKEQLKRYTEERRLREEAERQRAELQALALKVKTRGRWVFLLVILLLILGYITAGYYRVTLSNARKSLDETRDTLIINKVGTIQTIADDSILTHGTEQSKDSIKQMVFTLLQNDDIISQYNENTAPYIDSLINTVFKDDFRKKKINPNNLTITQKIDTLRKKFKKPISSTVWPGAKPIRVPVNTMKD